MTKNVTYQPGDRVRVELGAHTVTAEVLEDLRQRGSDGEGILRIGWTPAESDERIEIDVPSSRVSPEGLPFEEQVERILLRSTASVTQLGADSGADFVVNTGDREILFQAKHFAGAVPAAQLSQAERQLRAAKDTFRAADAVLVLPAWNRLLTRRGSRSGVHVVSVGQLEDWLAAHAT